MVMTKHLISDLQAVAQQLGLSQEAVSYCLEVELVQPPLTETTLAELRRIRRLQELEVNLPGVEIILRMRWRMQAMQARMEAMAAELAEAQARYEHELRELERRLAHDSF